MIGIYLLKHKDVVVYVGQSIHLETRIQTHNREGIKKFDTFELLECKKKRLDTLEYKMIQKYLPKYNKKDVYGVCEKKDRKSMTVSAVLGRIKNRANKDNKSISVCYTSFIITFTTYESKLVYKMHLLDAIKYYDIQIRQHEKFNKKKYKKSYIKWLKLKGCTDES